MDLRQKLFDLVNWELLKAFGYTRSRELDIPVSFDDDPTLEICRDELERKIKQTRRPL